jgi:cardiolipin synthase
MSVTIEPTPRTRHVRVAGSDWKLFVESKQYIQSLVNDIRTARHRVWVEAYSFADDAAGRAVAEAMKERAQAGVECRIIYDAAGSLETPQAMFDDLRAHGVAVKGFRPIDGWWWKIWRWGKFQRRDHRKLAVVDDEIGYFGGMNIVDQGGSLIPGTASEHEKHDPNEPPWHDVQVRIQGKHAAELAASWDDLWSELHDLPSPHRSNPRPRDLQRMAPDSILFFDSRPHVRYRRPAKFLRTLIDRSRSQIIMAIAYFLPFGSVLRAITRARKRKVTIRVIVPENSDVPVVQLASRYEYERLMRRGIRIYERQERMLHSKVMVIDDEWSLIGSLNLDPRSLLLNMEYFAVIRSKELAQALTEICREEFRHSRAVRRRDIHGRTHWERFKQWFCWTFKRWL